MQSPFPAMQATIQETGIWSGERVRTHAFQVSPSVFELSAEQRAELDELAIATDEALTGISRIMAISERSDLYGPAAPYAKVGSTLKLGTPYKLPNNRPRNLPILRKCDLLIDEQGHIWIAEIDATNPRSWGYSIIGRRLSECVRPGAEMLPGVAAFIASECKRRKVSELTFLFGNTQRFYEPEFRIIARELKQLGINMVVIDEVDVDVSTGAMRHARSGEMLPTTLIDFPFMNRNKSLIDWLRAGVMDGSQQFLVPPKHFLASKALLGVLSNAGGDPAIETLLRSQISEAALVCIRTHLPMTRIIGKGWDVPDLGDYRGMVLKQAVSSGMRNIYFGGEPEFNEALTAASRERGAHILQAEVSNRQYDWRRFDATGQLLPTERWQLRLTAYFSRSGVEDIAITARTDRAVHGSKDAIITGTVLV